MKKKRRDAGETATVIAAEEILRLLISEGVIGPGAAAGCLRGIANRITASRYYEVFGNNGRSIEEVLVERAAQIGEVVNDTPITSFYLDKSATRKT